MLITLIFGVPFVLVVFITLVHTHEKAGDCKPAHGLNYNSR